MICAHCATPFKRESLGQWTKDCDCDTRRYLSKLEPLHKDRVAYHQLTGRMPPMLHGLYLYGPKDQ